jgi:flagellar FliJ protein
MKTLRSLIRLHRAQLDERRRELVAVESRRAEVELARQRMEQQLLDEQRVAAGNFELSFGYPNYARAVLQRRQAFAEQLAQLDAEIAKAVAAVADTFQEVKRYETALDNHQRRLRAEEEHRHQAALDEIALTMHRRKEQERA